MNSGHGVFSIFLSLSGKDEVLIVFKVSRRCALVLIHIHIACQGSSFYMLLENLLEDTNVCVCPFFYSFFYCNRPTATEVSRVFRVLLSQVTEMTENEFVHHVKQRNLHSHLL